MQQPFGPEDFLPEYELTVPNLAKALGSGPSERSAGVLTVWIVLFGGDIPQFVTAFPGEVT